MNIKNKEIHSSFRKLDELIIREFPSQKPIIVTQSQVKQVKYSNDSQQNDGPFQKGLKGNDSRRGSLDRMASPNSNSEARNIVNRMKKQQSKLQESSKGSSKSRPVSAFPIDSKSRLLLSQQQAKSQAQIRLDPKISMAEKRVLSQNGKANNDSLESQHQHQPILSLNQKFLYQNMKHQQPFLLKVSTKQNLLSNAPLQKFNQPGSYSTIPFKQSMISTFQSFQKEQNKIRGIHNSQQQRQQNDNTSSLRGSLYLNDQKQQNQMFSSSYASNGAAQNQQIASMRNSYSLLNYKDQNLSGSRGHLYTEGNGDTKMERPMSAIVIKKSGSQKRLFSARPNTNYDRQNGESSQFKNQQYLQAAISIDSDRDQRKSIVNSNVGGSRNQKNILKNSANTRPQTAIKSNSTRSLFHPKLFQSPTSNHNSKRNHINLMASGFSGMDTQSIFDDNQNRQNHKSQQSVIISIQNMSVPERAKLQMYARKTVNQFNVDKNCEESQSVSTLSVAQMNMLFVARCQDLGVQYKEHLFEKFKEHCERFCVNRKLTFSDMNLGINCAKVLSTFLMYHQLDISHLQLSRNLLQDEGIQLLSQAISMNKTLIHLDLAQNEMTQQGAITLFSALCGNESVISIDIGSYDGQNRNKMGMIGIGYLKRLLMQSNTILGHVHLAGNYIGNKGLKLLAEGLQNNQRVVDLDLTNNEIYGRQGAEIISQILELPGNSIQRLILQKNHLGNSGISIISDCLRQSRLAYLSLVQCGFNQVGAKQLYQAVRVSYSLRSLILDKNDLEGASIWGLTNMLQTNTSLQYLSMAHCSMRDDGAQAIIDGLERNQALKHINLQSNKITDIGAKFFGEKFKSYRLYLKNLDIGFNMLTRIGGKAIMTSLIINDSIEVLHINNNAIGDDSALELIETLKGQAGNKKLRKVVLHHNGINVRYIEEINGYLSKNEAIAINSVLPNFQNEIVTMQNDKKEYVETCKDLFDLQNKKTKVSKQNNQSEEEFEMLKSNEEAKYQAVVDNLVKSQNRMREQDLAVDNLDMKRKDIEKQGNAKEREFRALINNTLKEQKALEQQSDEARLGIKAYKDEYLGKIKELRDELEGVLKKKELEKRSCETIEEILNDTKKFLEEAKKKKTLESLNIKEEPPLVLEDEQKEVKKTTQNRKVKKMQSKKIGGSSSPTKNKQVVKIGK